MKKINFGNIGIILEIDKWTANTTRYATESIVFYNEVFAGKEIIMLQKIMQAFYSNKMQKNKRYKITDRVYAQTVEKHECMLALLTKDDEEITLLDKVYALFYSSAIQTILRKFPIFFPES